MVEVNTPSTGDAKSANLDATKDTRHRLIADKLAQQHAKYTGACVLTIDSARALLTDLMGVMFPHYSARPCRETICQALDRLNTRLVDLIKASDSSGQLQAEAVAADYLAKLPEIATKSEIDAQALLEGDPAARSLEEVVLAYPGFYAVTAYRLAHELLQLNVPILPRLITEFAHQHTGIDIHPGAKIGPRFYIDHGTGVVIGETTVIGANVKIYQGVTLGGLKVDKGMDGKRHPTIEDNVTIYAGATILGGQTIVGSNSIIGGNVWLTDSVPAWSRVMFKSCDSAEIVQLKPAV